MTQEHTPNDTSANEQAEHDRAEALAAKVDELQLSLIQLKEEQLRERADLENQRKRMIRDVEQARKFGNERLLGDLLPVLDSLERGLQSAAGADSLVREGMDLTLKQLLKVCESGGLVEVAPAAGTAFNPVHHQAMTAQHSDAVPPNSVIQVFQKGYLLNDRLLRPALVVVSQAE